MRAQGHFPRERRFCLLILSFSGHECDFGLRPQACYRTAPRQPYSIPMSYMGIRSAS
jgi:hypothetical protein